VARRRAAAPFCRIGTVVGGRAPPSRAEGGKASRNPTTSSVSDRRTLGPRPNAPPRRAIEAERACELRCPEARRSIGYSRRSSRQSGF
jgi:hypothetical protein